MRKGFWRRLGTIVLCVALSVGALTAIARWTDGSYDITGTDNNDYMGDVSPDYDSKPAERIYGAFEAKSGVTYHVNFVVPYAGAVIDEVVYPCLVEDTEPGDFYIYK